MDSVKEALQRMRVCREKFAVHHSKTNLRSPQEASSLVEIMATSVVDFVTEGMKNSSSLGFPDMPSVNPIQITTEPQVVRRAMQHQQHRAEVGRH